METLKSYKEYITKHYNPKQEKLTEKEFGDLFYGWALGSTECANKLFKKTCYLAYDYVAYLFAKGQLHGNFEDALQNTFLILKKAKDKNRPIRLKICDLPDILKNYKRDVARVVFFSLKNLEREEKRQSTRRKIKSISKNPEELAINKLNREELIKIILKLPSNSPFRDRNNKFLVDTLIFGKSYTECAKENNIKQGTVQKNVVQNISKLRTYPNLKNDYLK